MNSDSEDERANAVFAAFTRDFTAEEQPQRVPAPEVEQSASLFPESSFLRGNISSIPPADDSANVLRSFSTSAFAAGPDELPSGHGRGSFSYGYDYEGYAAEAEEDEGPVINVVVCDGVVLPVPVLALPSNKVHTLRQYITDRILGEPGVPATRQFVSKLHGMKLKQKRVILRDDWDLDVVDPDDEVIAVLPDDVQRMLSAVLAPTAAMREQPEELAPAVPRTLVMDEDEYEDEEAGFGDEDGEMSGAADNDLGGLLAVTAGGVIDEREEFHHVLSTNRLADAAAGDPSSLQRYAEICNRKHADLNARKRANAKWEIEADEMRLERNTWKLFHDLHSAGFVDDLEPLDKRELEDLIRQMPDFYEPADIINELYRHSRSLARWHYIISWLEQTASQAFIDCDEARMAWEATAKAVRQRLKVKVASLDPDAQVSDRGLHALEGDDNEVQEQLMQNVWLAIRSGQLGLAQRLCDDQKYHWLAAALAGCLFTERINEEEQHAGQIHARRPRFGNLNRPAWLLRAWRYADHLSDRRYAGPGQLYEAAVFATLSGNLPALLDNLHVSTWEDQMWAYFKVLHDRVCTWAVHVYNLQRADESNLFPGASAQQLDDGARYLQASAALDALDVVEIFAELESFVAELERPEHQTFYYAVQRAAVLGPNSLQQFILTDCTQLLQDATASTHAKRFLAHLGIYLRYNLAHVLTSARVSADATLDALVVPYIDELETQRYLQLVALYARYLTDDVQLDRFSDFIVTITSSAERQQVFDSAKQVFEIQTLGQILDEAVTKMIRAESGASSTVASSKDIFVLQSMEEEDDEKIRALEWLHFHREFFDAAIVQSNRLIRKFIIESNGKKCILDDILTGQMTPEFEQHVADRADEADPHAMEFGDWHRYATAVFAVRQWRDLEHKLQRAGAPADQQAAFEDFAREAVAALEDLIFEGFLDIAHDEEQLFDELAACKSIVLRQAVLWLQRIYFQTGSLSLGCQPHREQELRQWWEDAAKVAEVVAADKYKLLDVLPNDVLHEVLKGVHASSMALLKLDEQEARRSRR